MSKNFKGTGVAVVTPFNNKLQVDYTALNRIIEHLIAGGVNYLVLLGTTGESATLGEHEKTDLLHHCVQFIDGRLPIVAGFGGNDTAKVIKQIKNQNFEGIDAILSVNPYYNKPSQEGLYRHYAAIAERCPVSVILYNVPSRTGGNLKPETVTRLAADYPNIVGVKEASGSVAQCMDLVQQNERDDFFILSGDDALTLPMMALGADGVISVAANVVPEPVSRMVRLALDSSFNQARLVHYQLLPIFELLFVEGNPSGIKAALSSQGLCENVLRSPLVEMSQAKHIQMANALHMFAGDIEV